MYASHQFFTKQKSGISVVVRLKLLHNHNKFAMNITQPTYITQVSGIGKWKMMFGVARIQNNINYTAVQMVNTIT